MSHTAQSLPSLQSNVPSSTKQNSPGPDLVPDPFDSLLNLEETFYQQGHVLGTADGARQGLVEGRVFGFERGFDKFFSMARLHGHTIVLGNRLPGIVGMDTAPSRPSDEQAALRDLHGGGLRSESVPNGPEDELDLSPNGAEAMRLDLLSGATARVEKHVRTLYALTEPASLSLVNAEDEVSAFEDRYKRALAKATILTKMVGYEIGEENAAAKVSEGDGEQAEGAKVKGRSAEPSIEDVSILQARH